MILALWYHTLLAFLFAVVCLLIMGVILLQRGRGTGLAGAFGGMGGASATFGSKTGDVLTWITVVGAAIYMVCAVFLNYAFVPPKPEAPAAAPTTPAAPTSGAPTDGAPPPSLPSSGQRTPHEWRDPTDPNNEIKPAFAGALIFGEPDA